MPLKASLCVPTYNGATYLRQALESACAQNFRDLEVLVVDDRSTDGTVAIAEEFAARDARVRVHVNPQTLGLPGNWDRARELAAGEWVLFLFQDDVFDPSCLETMLKAAEDAGGQIPIVCCRREVLLPEGSEEEHVSFLDYIHRHSMARYFPGKSIITAEAFCKQFVRTPTANFVGEPTAVMLHGSTLGRFGPFHPAVRPLVDFEYWARIATVTGIVYVDRPLVTFRVHAKSASSANRGAAVRKDRLDSIILLDDLLHKPAYAQLRRSPGRRARLLWLFAARTFALRQPPGPPRDPADPPWTDALALYPPLRHPGPLARLALALYRLRRALRPLRR